MVTNNREYEVARTIPSVSGVKAKYLPASAGEAQVAVEDAYRSAVHINSRADGRHGGRSEVYLAVGVVGACSGGGGVESESSDVAKAFQVSTVDDGLREGIVIVCVGGTIAGGSVAHGRVEVLCGVAVVAETRRCRHHFPNTGVGARADMANVGVVAGKRGKAGEGSHGVGYKQHGTIAVGEACGAVFNLPAEASGRIGPSNVDARCRSIGGVQCLYFGTSGDVVEGDVVDISIPARGGTVGLDGYVLASAGIGVQQYLILSKCGVAIDVNGINAYKGAGSVGIGHHTNLEYGVVAARRSLSPEAELQCRSVGSRVDGRQNDNLVVAIGAGGGSVVPVEALGAASGVVVGGGRAYIGIAAVGGTVVETGPAANEGRTGSGAAGGFGLEVLGVGQCDGAAGGAEGVGLPQRGVASAADRAYAEGVLGRGREAGEYSLGVANHNGSVVAELVFPLRGVAGFGPGDGGAVLAEVAAGDVERAAAREAHDFDVVDASGGGVVNRAVVVPSEYHVVNAGGRHVNGARLSGPGAGEVELGVAVERNPAAGQRGAAEAGGSGGAANERFGTAHEGYAEVVERRFAVALPIEAVGILADGVEHEVDIRVHGLESAAVARAGAVVVADVEGVGAEVVFGSADNPLVVDRTIGDGPGVVDGGVLKVAAEGQRVVAVGGGEGSTAAGSYARAVGGNDEVVGGVSVQAGNGEGQAGSGELGAVALGESHCAVFNGPRGGVAVLAPGEGNLVGVEACEGDVGNGGTVGLFFDDEVVEEEVVGLACAVELQSDAAARSGVAGQVSLNVLVGVAADGDGVAGNKRGGVGAVAHHAHNDVARGGGGVHLAPEGNHEVVHVVNRVVDFGEDGVDVVGVGVGRERQVVVDEAGAGVSAVGPAGDAAYVAKVVLAGVVEASPAGDAEVGSGAAGGHAFEAFAPGQLGDSRARSAEVQSGVDGGIAANGTYANLIQGVGAEVGDGGGGVAGCHFGAVPAAVGHGAVVNIPAGLLIAGYPADGGAGSVVAVEAGNGSHAGSIG